MKNLFVLLLIGTSLSFAQRSSLFKGEFESGGYGGPIIHTGTVNGASAVFVGGKGGWIVNHSVIIGGGAYGLVSNVPAKNVGPNGETQMMFGYGGFIVEYWYNADKLVHLSGSLLLGSGGLDYKNPGNGNSDMANFFVAEPSVGVNLNMTEYLTLGAGASYRVLSNFTSPVADSKDLEGASVYFVAKFGKF